jgi:hypothetical protein
MAVMAGEYGQQFSQRISFSHFSLRCKEMKGGGTLSMTKHNVIICRDSERERERNKNALCSYATLQSVLAEKLIAPEKEM